MINEDMEKALNGQINAELYSAYLYLSMSAYFKSTNLPGFANWMRVQVQEELVHAMRLYDFVAERGGRVILTTVAAPPTDWNSPLAVLEATYAHECKVTGMINELMDLAKKTKDHATEIMLQWFVTEQIEEEASADEIVQKLKFAEKAPGQLLMLDQQLGQRTFTAPAASAEA